MSTIEPPFRPREKLIEKQKFFQNVSKHTYVKGPYDKITSVAIPLALAWLFSLSYWERDLQHVSWDREEGIRGSSSQ